MKGYLNNSDLSTSPETTEESPGSSATTNNENCSVSNFDFEYKYERLTRMINNIVVVFNEYEMNIDIKNKKQIEIENLIRELELLKAEWRDVICDSKDKALNRLKKATEDTKRSIIKINNIQKNIDMIKRQDLKEDDLTDNFEQCKDLELDVEYLLLKLTCDRQNELLREYQCKINELKKTYDHLILTESNTLSNKKLTKIIDKEGLIDRQKHNFIDEDTQEEDNYIFSILGQRDLMGENDQILELLRMENDIQGEILSHISKIMEISI